MFFSVFRHIQVNQVFVSYFPLFSIFSPYFRPTVCISHFSRFSLFHAILQVLQFAFPIYHVLHCFCHFSGPKVCVSHFRRVLVSCHTPGPPVFISHFSGFSVFHAILQAIQYLYLIFHDFQVSRHNTSYTMYFSYFKVFTASHHIPGPRVCVSHFSRFSVFLAIF